MRPTPIHLIGTPLLKNTGSTARDHLASERTFLAWMRTGLGFTALGIAVERFSQFDPAFNPAFSPITTTASPSSSSSSSYAPSDAPHAHHPRRSPQDLIHQKEKEHLLVAALLGTGFGSIVYGVTRYFLNMRLLERGMFKPSYFGAAGLSVGVAALAGGAYVGALGERLKGREIEKERGKREKEGEKGRRVGEHYERGRR